MKKIISILLLALLCQTTHALPESKHLILEAMNCSVEKLNDHNYLEKLLKKSATAGGMHVLGTISHQFKPQGASSLLLLAESHLSIHTWPEHNYAALDLFTCGPADMEKMRDMLQEGLECEFINEALIVRDGTIQLMAIESRPATPKKAQICDMEEEDGQCNAEVAKK